MKTIRFFIAVIAAMLVATALVAQTDDVRFSPEDEKVFDSVMEKVIGEKEAPISDLVTCIALQFLKTPYVANTLEQVPEMLTVNMHETDCILFVEMCVALACNIKLYQNPQFGNYCDRIRSMRYRDGIVDGYDSRIHYTSEWILQNAENKIMKEITSRYGKPLNQTFSYMSTHPQSYPQLRDSDDLVRRISVIEKNLNGKGPYYYIPQTKLREMQGEIKNGDIICFISNVEGLDISHVAIAYWVKDELHFIHASSKEKKVVIEKQKLADYARNGIRIARLL